MKVTVEGQEGQDHDSMLICSLAGIDQMLPCLVFDKEMHNYMLYKYEINL